MLFKDFFYFKLGPPFCSAVPNHLCNFGKKDNNKNKKTQEVL